MPPRDDLSSLEWRMKSGARYTDSRLNWASLSRSGGNATPILLSCLAARGTRTGVAPVIDGLEVVERD